MEEALPLMMAMDILCLSHVVSRFSPVTELIRRPSSATNLLLLLPRTPEVSTESGSKRYLSVRQLYWVRLRASALSAATPGVMQLSLMSEGANVSEQVASQQRLRPAENGKAVRPSGRFPSLLLRPTGSSHEGIPAELKDRFTMSLRCE